MLCLAYHDNELTNMSALTWLFTSVRASDPGHTLF